MNFIGYRLNASGNVFVFFQAKEINTTNKILSKLLIKTHVYKKVFISI